MSINSDYDLHERKISEFFRSDISVHPADCEFLANYDVVFVVFHNRSGSNMVCDLLGQCSDYSIGGEVFNYDFVISACTKHKISSFSHYVKAIIKDNFSADRIPVLKASPAQFEMLFSKGYVPALKRYNVIYCKRSDLVSQAVSQLIAESTNEWKFVVDEKFSDCGEQPGRSEALRWEQFQLNFRSPDEAFRRILSIIEHNVHEMSRAETLWSRLGESPLILGYESMIGLGAQRLLEGILQHLNINPKSSRCLDDVAVRLKKQASQLNSEVAERFVSWCESSSEFAQRRTVLGIDPLTTYSPESVSRRLV